VRLMKYIGIVKKIVENNMWLNGRYDFWSGDLVAIVNQPEKFLREPKEVHDISELFNDLKNYEGVWKFNNLLFFKDANYGTFVYDLSEPNPSRYVEHLSVDGMSEERFKKIVLYLIRGKQR